VDRDPRDERGGILKFGLWNTTRPLGLDSVEMTDVRNENNWVQSGNEGRARERSRPDRAGSKIESKFLAMDPQNFLIEVIQGFFKMLVTGVSIF
jgi:hypothetical protein